MRRKYGTIIKTVVRFVYMGKQIPRRSPSLYYRRPDNANNHSYSWQIHAGLATEGAVPPAKTLSRSRDSRERP